MPKQIFNPLTGSFDQVIDQASELNYSPSTPSEWPTLPAKVDDALDYLRADLVGNAELIKEPTGFPNRTDTTLSFVDGTREFTIAPTGASFDVYVKGKKFTKTSESIVLSNDDGNHYIFYNSSGVLTETTAFDPSIFSDNALISIIYWNSSNNLHTYFAEERHGLVMDGATHGYLHTVFGARYLTGLALQSFVVDGDGSLNTQAQFQADAGTIRDEDIIVSLAADSTIPVLYRQGTLWRKKPADAYPVIYNGTAGYVGTNIAYNQLVGASWQLTQVINNNFVLMHIFATNDIENPFVAILGINSYANIPEARTGAESEISSLSGLPFAEFVAVGTVIYQTNSAYINVPKAIVRSASAGEDYVDFRGEQLYTPSGIATSHSLLSNLSSDDHLQYYNEARGDARYVRDGANLGATGESVFAQKNTTNLEFKKLKAGTNVSLASDAESITISSTDTGEVNTASNVGTGSGVFKQKTGVDLEFKSLTSGSGITLTSNVDDVQIAASYNPSVPGDWTTAPDTPSEALDELAARITTANGEVVLDVQSFSGDALQTVFALSPAPASGDSFLVFIDGVYQLQSSYSYVSPNITFTSAPPTGTNNIEVRVASADLIVNGILPTTTKGDLVVHDGIQNVRLPVGADGGLLYADSTETSGVKWRQYSDLFNNYSLMNPEFLSSSIIAQWNKIAFDNVQTLVAVGSTSTATNPIMSSGDAGITWTQRTTTATSLNSIIYANGLFVAVGNAIVTSTAGAAWTARTSPTINHTDITYGNGLFVVVANSIITSPDGITWTARVTPGGYTKIAFGNNIFIAVGSSGAVATSPDGINWTARPAPTVQNISGICFGNGIFVAYLGGGSSKLLSTQDGITWTDLNQTAIPSIMSICFGNGLFFVLGATLNGVNKIATSKNGIDWEIFSTRYLSSGGNTNSMVFAYNRFIGVGGSVGNPATQNNVVRTMVMF